MPAGCNLCGGAGWRHIHDRYLQRCECRPLAELTPEQVREMGIPPAFQRMDLRNFIPGHPERESAFQIVSRLSCCVEDRQGEPWPAGLVLIGAAGTGKTHLAIGLMKEYWRMGFQGIFVNHREWMETVRKSRAGDPIADSGFRKLLSVDVLLLDDLTTLRDLPEPIVELIPALIKHRHNHMKTIIVTTRLPPDDPKKSSLAQILGYPSISRLSAMCHILELS